MMSRTECWPRCGEWLADEKRPKIVHDPKLFSLLAVPDSPAATRGIAGIAHATMLYSFLVRPTTANHVFAEVVLRHLNRTLSGAPGERADFLLRLAPALRAEVDKLGLAKLYETIDFPLASVLARMEAAGVRVDKKELDMISTKAQEEISRLEKSIYELAGFEFKINSPQQLAEVLFDKLNLQPPRRSRVKSRSTAAEVLEELALLHELPKKVLEYRELAKVKSTYADALPRLIHPITGRLHTRFSQTGAVTGRLSSANPNLQNIPIRTELGREIRAAFVAPPGRLLLSADYSQIELRILAHLSEDPILIGRFPPRRRHPLAHRAGSLWRAAARADARASPRGQGDQFRRDLRPFAVRPGAESRHRHERSREIHRRLFRTLQRREEISRPPDRRDAQDAGSRRRFSAASAPCRKSLLPSPTCAISPSAPP